MRVVTKGRFTNPPASSPPWWVGRQATCAVCGAVLEVQPSDVPYQEPGVTADTTLRVAFTCPEPHPDNQGAVVLRRY